MKKTLLSALITAPFSVTASQLPPLEEWNCETETQQCSLHSEDGKSIYIDLENRTLYAYNNHGEGGYLNVDEQGLHLSNADYTQSINIYKDSNGVTSISIHDEWAGKQAYIDKNSMSLSDNENSLSASRSEGYSDLNVQTADASLSASKWDNSKNLNISSNGVSIDAYQYDTGESQVYIHDDKTGKSVSTEKRSDGSQILNASKTLDNGVRASLNLDSEYGSGLHFNKGETHLSFNDDGSTVLSNESNQILAKNDDGSTWASNGDVSAYKDGSTVWFHVDGQDIEAEVLGYENGKATLEIDGQTYIVDRDGNVEMPPQVSPIEGEKPVPSEGQKIVEGLKKAADKLREMNPGNGDETIIIGDGKHAERKQAHEDAREERKEERQDKGLVVVRPIEEPLQPTPEAPINIEKPMPIHNGKNPFEGSKGTQAREVYDAGMAELYEQGRQNSADIDTLFGEIDRLDDRMDGVVATSHAVVNAKPSLMKAGQSGVGVGTGFAGSTSAIAVGVAHSFNENWSTSATMNATTGLESELSAGAGVAFVW